MMLQVRENRIKLSDIGSGLNGNFGQSAFFAATPGGGSASEPVRIFEPESALDLSVADKKIIPEVASDIEAAQSDPPPQHNPTAASVNVRKSRLLEASHAQTTPLNSLSRLTSSRSSPNLALNTPFWPRGPAACDNADPGGGDQLLSPTKKMRLAVPADCRAAVPVPDRPAGLATLAPSPTNPDDGGPSYSHQYQALSQRLPQIDPGVLALLAASSYGRQPEVGAHRPAPALDLWQRPLGPSLGQQQQQQRVGGGGGGPAEPMKQLGEPLSATLEMVQAKIGKDHKLIPILRKMAFRCHVCGSCFEDRHRLQQHLSIHLQLQPSWFEERTIKDTMAKYESRRGDYLCTICRLRHDTTAEFDKHMQTHGERPHQCELCLKDNKTVSFRFFRQLLTHLRSHCFIYNCRYAPDCKQTANRKDYLKLHILKHHLNNKLSEQHVMAAHHRHAADG